MRSSKDSEAGASAVEYAILVSAVAAVLVFVIAALGATTNAGYQDSCARLSAEMGGEC